MRYTQIILSITILFLYTTTRAADPLDIVGIEQRLDDLEARVDLLEGKSPTTAKSCPCPDGPCICDPDNCNCPNCPEHVGTRLDAKLRILAFHADWCGPCKVAESQAKAAGVDGRVIHYDFDRDRATAEMLGVTQIPALLLVKDERVVGRHVGPAGYVAQIREWLKNPSAKSAPKLQSVSKPVQSRVIRYDAPPVRYDYGSPMRASYSCGPGGCGPAYSPPRTYYRPYYGYSYGGCANCR